VSSIDPAYGTELSLPGMEPAAPTPAALPAINTREARLIGELRGKGLGYGDIAAVLNARNVPTRTGRGRWHAETVRRHYDPAARRVWAEYIARYKTRWGLSGYRQGP